MVTAFQSNSSERSAFLLTSGFLVNHPILYDVLEPVVARKHFAEAILLVFFSGQSGGQKQ